MQSADLIEIWRGGRLESRHGGHVVICDKSGVVEAWGRPSQILFPRSACKMMQALPLLESGAADAAGLTDRQLALACGSHSGARQHVDEVGAWLSGLGLGERDLLCGCHMPRDRDESRHLLCAGTAPCQLHNNCSGKHAGFLTLGRHLGGGPDYLDTAHPVQRAVRAAFEEVADEDSPGHAIDGCSAPNWACSLEGLGRAMAAFAAPGGDRRGRAMQRLVAAMRRHPEMVAGEGMACTALIRAMPGGGVAKTGAEGVFVAILPGQGLGVALKVDDGAGRASQAAIAVILRHLGVLDRDDPAVSRYLPGPIRNWRGIVTGEMRSAPGFPE